VDKPSAKAAFEAMIAAHVPNATAHELITKGCADGTYQDDMEKGGEGSASAAHADLIAKGLSDEMATAAVRSMVAAGKVTDDIGIAKGVDFAAVDAALDELRKSGGDAPTLGDLDFDPAAHEDALDRAAALVDAVSARADSVIKGAYSGQANLVRGFEALATVQKGLADAVAGRNAALEAKLDAIQKGLDAVTGALNLPVEPRGVTGAKPIPHPGERAPAGGAVEDAVAKGERLMGDYQAELNKGGVDRSRSQKLADAIGRLHAGEHPDTVTADLGL